MSYPTGSDLNSPAIVPPPGNNRGRRARGQKNAGAEGTAALMVSAAPDMALIRQGEGPWRSRDVLNSHLLVREDDLPGLCVAGPYIGAPYGVMLLESLIARGARAVIVLGWCGGLHPDVVPGDLVVVRTALVDEGTSRHYMDLRGQQLPAVSADAHLAAVLGDALGDAGLDSHARATIWTTDAIFRETPEKAAWYRDKGACAVEMECSALFAAAAFRKIPVAALLVVSDTLAAADGTWVWHPGFEEKRFKTMRKRACGLAVEVTGRLTSGF